MYILNIVSAAAILASTAAAHAIDAPTPASLAQRADKTVPPKCWSGTAFPAKAAWSPFPSAYQVAEGAMIYGNDTKKEIQDIRESIIAIAKESGYDARFILAIMRRESDGRTTIPCGDQGKSCGIMQVHGNNVPSCKKHPCPKKKIKRMVKCGVEGCGAASISECASRYGKNNYGELARCYNSGIVADPKDLTQTGQYGVRSYVQDVANLLLASDYATWSQFDDGRCGFTNS